jgi:soluble P-type ATPase
MLEFDIPGLGEYTFSHLVCDFTGTLSIDGTLIAGVAEALRNVSQHLTVHVVTADTMSTAQAALAALPCTLKVLSGSDTAVGKLRYVQELDPKRVIAFGNGRNDRLLLKTAAIGVAVTEAEGCAVEATDASDIIVRTIHDAFDLIKNPNRIRATLRG